MKAGPFPRPDLAMVVLSTLLILALVCFAVLGFIVIVLALIWWPLSIAIAVIIFVADLLKFAMGVVWTA
jgi:hypothetical protein